MECVHSYGSVRSKNTRSSRRGFTFIPLCVAATISLAFPADAAEKPAVELTKDAKEQIRFLKEETVVTASRYEQPISEAPSNVYVITEDDIRQSGAPDVPTILRRIPGMEVMQTTAADFNVSVRGNNQLLANKLLVLVDGRSIYMDAQGIVFWKLIPVTLPEIKRIEVVKGPAAAVWGFNAFDGVVNIITKRPDEMSGTTVQIVGGEFGTWANSAVVAGKHEKMGYRLSVGHDQAQQWDSRNALGLRAYKFNVMTTYDLPGDSGISVSGGLVDSNRFDTITGDVSRSNSTPAQGYAYVAYSRPNAFVRAWWTGTYIDTYTGVQPSLVPFFRLTNREGSQLFSVAAHTYNIEAQQTTALWRDNHLTYGVNYRYNTLAGNYFARYAAENRFGLYVQDEWQITNQFRAVAGIRYDLDTFIHPQWSPRVALLYQFARDHTLRASVSVGYRPPTLSETYLDLQNQITIPTPTGTATLERPTLGSSELKPERIVTYEVGYQGWYFHHRVRLRTDLFFNHITDLINFEPTGQGLTTVAMNGGVGDIYGAETGVEFLATAWLTGFANYAFQEVGQNFTGRVQRAVPRHKANVGLRGEWENGLSAEVWFHHYGAATYPVVGFAPFAPLGVGQPDPRVRSYNLLNLRAGYRFWHEKAELAVAGFNMLDDRHREHPVGNIIERRIMGWLTVKF